MNPQIVLNFNLATETGKFVEGQGALETSDVQSLPTPSVVSTSIFGTAVASPTPADYAATVSSTSDTLPTPLGSEATQSDTNITLPTPMDTISATFGIIEQGAPTPMNAIAIASATANSGGLPTPFDNRQESAASIVDNHAIPKPTGSNQSAINTPLPEPKGIEPTGSDFHSDDKEPNTKRKMK
jgi:hypothetical protein